MDTDPTQRLLTSLSLSLHDATDLRPNIRNVREQVQQELPDLDSDLVEDLLISAACRMTAPDFDVDTLTRLWGTAVLQAAAPRLIEVLDEMSRRT